MKDFYFDVTEDGHQILDSDSKLWQFKMPAKHSNKFTKKYNKKKRNKIINKRKNK